jgi:tRNA(fMet)-specific endonuclease VapC
VIILDTDVLSELMRPQPQVALVERLEQVPPDEQCTTAVTIGELAYGAIRVDRPELFDRAMQLLGDTVVLPFDREAGERYGRIRSDLERNGTRLPDPDLRIAATALVHDGTLITGNTKHFARIPGLQLEDWLRG